MFILEIMSFINLIYQFKTLIIKEVIFLEASECQVDGVVYMDLIQHREEYLKVEHRDLN